jgi:hypothetical protein
VGGARERGVANLGEAKVGDFRNTSVRQQDILALNVAAKWKVRVEQAQSESGGSELSILSWMSLRPFLTFSLSICKFNGH